MKFRIAFALALLCYLAPVGLAFADSRPRISLDRATVAAERYVDEWNDSIDPEDEDPSFIQVTGVDLAGCDLETRYRVLCDVDVAWEDGEVDEDVITVFVTRRGTYLVKS
jgi:hypothetical protein